jgi:PRTRC genetic system protein C
MADKFVEYGGKRFPLDEGMTLEQAKDVMARHFPELAEPKVETKKEGEVTVYVFNKQVGRKGSVGRKGVRRGARRTANDLELRVNRLKPSRLLSPDLLAFAATGSGPDYVNVDRMYQLASALDAECKRVRDQGRALLDLRTSNGTPTGSIL